MSVAAARRAIRTSPALPLDTTAWLNSSGRIQSLSFSSRLTPQQAYTITIDSLTRDIYGRRLQGPRSFTVIGLDRVPGVAQQSGLVTLSHTNRSPAKVTIRTVNVDTLLLHLIPLPDSFIPRLLATPDRERYGLVPLMEPALRDTVRVIVPVHGTFNVEGNVDVPLPASFAARQQTGWFSMRFEIKAGSVRPESVSVDAKLRADRQRDLAQIQQLSAVIIRARRFDGPDLGLVVQLTPLVAHVKFAGSAGAVFVTDRAGAPVRGARASLHGGSGELLAMGTTGPDGLALMTRRRPLSVRVENVSQNVRYPGAQLRYVVVERGRDRLVVPATGFMATTLPMRLGASDFGTRGGPSSLMHAKVTADRDLYRPGETVTAKVYATFGLMGSRAPIAGDSVRMLLMRGTFYAIDGKLVSIGDGADTLGVRGSLLSAFGTAVDSIRIPPMARLGSYHLTFEVLREGSWHHLASQGLNIEEFRAPEYRIALTSDTSLRFVGDTIVTRLTGAYLFDRPMSNAKVAWRMSSASAWAPGRSIPGIEGFTVGLSEWWTGRNSEPQLYRSGTGRLDSNGEFSIRIPTTGGSLSLPTRLTIVADVTDLNNQTVSAQSYAVVQPSSVVVALKDRSESAFWKPGVAQQVDAMAVRMTGERMVGTPLRVTILRRRWLPDSNGFRYYATPWTVDTVLSRVIESRATTVPIQFTPSTEGAYDVRVETTDEKGRVSASNLGRWASASSVNSSFERSPLSLSVTTNSRARYSIGDIARVSFDSPFERADAWITIEREGVLSQQRKTVARGVTTLDIPIDRRLAPNAFVGVTLVERATRMRAGIDSASVPFRAGYAEIRVDSTVNRLQVVIEPPRAPVAPGDSVEIRVRVVGAHPSSKRFAAGSEIALWAVDEGVLSLTGFQTPDILSAIDQELGLGSILSSSFRLFPWIRPVGSVLPGVNVRRLGDGRMLAALSVEAGGVAGGVARPVVPAQILPSSLDLRSNFRLTAFFVGRTMADTSGVAIVRAKLPDNITTFRLMATATAAGGRYGSGEAPLLVTRHFVLRPALPRFLRAGDVFSANAILSVRDSMESAMQISVGVSNAMLQGDSLRSANVNGANSVRVRFPVSVPTASVADATRVVFTAFNAARTDGDAVATSIPLRPVTVPRAHVAIGMVRDSATVTIALPADIDPVRSRITLGLGTSPLVAMQVHERRLREHAYLTSDYIAASARARLSLGNARRAMGVRAGAADSLALLQDVQSAVETLARRQSPSGDFFYWATGPGASAWLTCHIGMFLLDARRAGATVSDAVVAGAVRSANVYLRGRVWEQDTIFGTPAERRHSVQSNLASRLAIVQFLRQAGVPANAVEDSLLESAPRMRWEDRVTLVGLLTQRADRRDTVRQMFAQLWRSVGVVGNRIDFPDSLLSAGPFISHVRPVARLLHLTMQLEPDHQMLGALRETLLRQSSAERGWAWNAHDHASAIEALAILAQQERNASPVRIVARDTDGRVVSSRIQSDTTGQSLSGLVTFRRDSAFVTLTVKVEGQDGGAPPTQGRSFYYAVTVHETPKDPPVTPDIAGMVVERWYEHFVDGTPVTSVAEGDLVRVRLRVTVPADRQFVALEDPLPAGLEIVDLSMRTTAIPGPFFANPQAQSRQRDVTNPRFDQVSVFGSWDSGWWSPWEYKEQRDDRVVYFTRLLWAGRHSTSYVARATTAGTFARPPAHASEMYNPAVQGRSDGGVFVVRPPP